MRRHRHRRRWLRSAVWELLPDGGQDKGSSGSKAAARSGSGACCPTTTTTRSCSRRCRPTSLPARLHRARHLPPPTRFKLRKRLDTPEVLRRLAREGRRLRARCQAAAVPRRPVLVVLCWHRGRPRPTGPAKKASGDILRHHLQRPDRRDRRQAHEPRQQVPVRHGPCELSLDAGRTVCCGVQGIGQSLHGHLPFELELDHPDP